MNGPVSALARKARQVLSDPTLRRWLFDRAMNRCVPTAAHRRTPEYLSGLTIADGAGGASGCGDLDAHAPHTPIEIELAGSRLRLVPGEEEQVFERHFGDTEALIALHRFAWIDRAGAAADPDWIDALWRSWMKRYAMPGASLAWHPYTCAERLINILSFARMRGLPGSREETLAVLTRHGAAIFDRLEYFGEGQTGNHLANNGRGLFIGGVALGRPDWVEVGERILREEAKRMFAPSGILREGSSHYHLLVSRWFDEVAVVATQADRAAAEEFRNIAAKARSIAAHLILPSGLPLIGDVSPDCPPDQLETAAHGSGSLVDRDGLAVDGWFRVDCASWHMMCHAAPTGWSPMPGHGHQDFGSFELAYDTTRLLCDVGRRSYDPPGDLDGAARSHNTVTVDGAEPYPVNKPYYDRAFRVRAAGREPTIVLGPDGAELRSLGFARLRGVGGWRRSWRFDGSSARIDDEIAGHGRHRVIRHLHTTLPVRQSGGNLEIGDFVLAVDGRIELSPSHRWRAYGVGESATSIDIVTEAELPWISTIKISRR